MPHLPGIDGLRAFAIVAVVLYHAGWKVLPSSFLGVDVFFVTSGFLITSLLLREQLKSGRVNLVTFWARRARRLLPAFMLVFSVILVTGSLWLLPYSEQYPLHFSAISASFVASNEYFLRQAGGYFSPEAAKTPLLHLWSLSVEEQFYLFWPLLILALGSKRIGRMPALPVAAALAGLASLMCSEWLTSQHPSAAYYSLTSRAWELLSGAGLAIWFHARPPFLANITGTILATAGALMILLTYRIADPTAGYPGLGAIPVVAGTLLILTSATRTPACAAMRFFGHAVPSTLGKISYGWYLWHWPLLAFVYIANPASNRAAWCAAAVVAGLLLGLLTFYLVEKPILDRTWTTVEQRFWLRAAAIALPSCALLSLALLANAKYLSPPLIPDSAVIADRDRHSLGTRCHRRVNAAADMESLDNCRLGAATRQTDLVIWGDSHAYSWMPMLQEASSTSRFSYLQATRPACPPLRDSRVPASVKRARSSIRPSRSRLKNWPMTRI